MIKSLVVKGLWGRYDYDLQFNEDVNIFTGSNGTGKTTLLKMLWYVYSGNYAQLISEIQFQKLVIGIKNSNSIIVDRGQAEIHYELWDSKEQVRITSLGESWDSLAFQTSIGKDKIRNGFDRYLVPVENETYFFPTFRRLEGGFSLHESSELINALRDFTSKMSKGKHRFISSSDSDDIKALVNKISSDIRLQQEIIDAEFMDFIKRQLGKNLPEFEKELKTNMQKKGQAEAQAKEPIDNLSKYVDQFFWEKSVKISENLKLGQHENEIDIENLSAGEKNLLSFLVYATSMKEGVMFIDEPELNLHIEWQRELVATLRDIAPNVQLFMASHSPGIYAGYADKAPWFNDLVRHTASNEPALVE